MLASYGRDRQFKTKHHQNKTKVLGLARWLSEYSACSESLTIRVQTLEHTPRQGEKTHWLPYVRCGMQPLAHHTHSIIINKYVFKKRLERNRKLFLTSSSKRAIVEDTGIRNGPPGSPSQFKLCACWTRARQLGSIPIHGKCVLIKRFNSQGLAANCPYTGKHGLLWVWGLGRA